MVPQLVPQPAARSPHDSPHGGFVYTVETRSANTVTIEFDFFPWRKHTVLLRWNERQLRWARAALTQGRLLDPWGNWGTHLAGPKVAR